MSAFYKTQVYEKPILTIVYQPWDKVAKEKLAKWKSHTSWTLRTEIKSCLDSLDVIKQFKMRKYPFALITDIYGHTGPVDFEAPWEIASIEIKLLD